MPEPSPRRAYTTLLTRPSYIPGALLLAHSLAKHGSKYPLILLYTPVSLEEEHIALLHAEARQTSLLHLRATTHLLPPREVFVVASRFEDTWTKLRCFALYDGYTPADDSDRFKNTTQDLNNTSDSDSSTHQSKPLHGYDEICYLDSDMLILRPGMDQIFTLPCAPLTDDNILATHSCVCNLDGDEWALPDWTRANCAYTPLKHASALSKPTPAPKIAECRAEGDPRTGVTSAAEDGVAGVKGEVKRYPYPHTLLNSGLLVFRPSKKLYSSLLTFLAEDSRVEKFSFPDQDLLTEFYRDRWVPVPWQFNALKTWRYWHGPATSVEVVAPDDELGEEAPQGLARVRERYRAHRTVLHLAEEAGESGGGGQVQPGMWRDEEVVNLHYIVDKPWSKRVEVKEGKKIAGYLGDDGETHSWWWREWDRFVARRWASGQLEIVKRLEGSVAKDEQWR